MRYAIFIGILFLNCVAFGQSREDLSKIIPESVAHPKLNYYLRVPDSIADGDSVTFVIVLHGCYQNAEEINRVAGWSKLADVYQFVILFPEQRFIENATGCFNWFEKDEIQDEDGSLHEIIGVVDQLKQRFIIDSKRTFVYGVSAGGMMSVSLLAEFPQYFNAGAVLAAGPYGMYGFKALGAMNKAIDNTPEEWAELIEIADSVYIPKVIIGHGTADRVVNFENSNELVEQWTAVHGIDLAEDSTFVFPQNEYITRFGYSDSTGHEKVVCYTFEGAGHVIPLDPGDGPKQGGILGRFTEDLDFFSTYYILKEFGIIPD